MRTDSIPFPPQEAFSDHKVVVLPDNFELPAKNWQFILDDNFQDFFSSKGTELLFNRQDSVGELLSNLSLPEDFQKDLAQGFAQVPSDSVAAEAAENSWVTGTSPVASEKVVTGADQQLALEEEEGMETMTYTVLGDASHDEAGVYGMAFNGGVSADGTEMVTVVLEGGDIVGECDVNGDDWTTLTTVDAGSIGIPTTTLEMADDDVHSNSSIATTFVSSICSNSGTFQNTGDETVFITPSTNASDRTNPFHFNSKRVCKNSQSTSGYSTRSSTRSSACYTPGSASTCSSDSSPSVFSDVTDDVSLMPISQDDALALQKLNLTPLLKENLKNKIRKRRHDSGLPDLQVDCKPKAKVKKEMNEEEYERYLKRRTQNRDAATRFRDKQRDIAKTLTDKCHRLEGSNSSLKSEIGRLMKETQELKQLLTGHMQVCPKMARTQYR